MPSAQLWGDLPLRVMTMLMADIELGLDTRLEAVFMRAEDVKRMSGLKPPDVGEGSLCGIPVYFSPYMQRGKVYLRDALGQITVIELPKETNG